MASGTLLINQKETAWIANRNKLISRKFGALKIDSTGDLKILDKGVTQLMLMKSDQGASRTVAVLTDTGNFELHELNSDGSAVDKILWQSFDYPTDTLPGVRLGFNYKKGKSWFLSSWVSDRLPASGPFRLGLDPNGTNQLIIWKRGEIQWSGKWHSGKFLNFIDYPYRFDYVSNDNEKYFTMSVENSWWQTSFPMYKIDTKGVISHFESPESDRSLYSSSYGSELALTTNPVWKPL